MEYSYDRFCNHRAYYCNNYCEANKKTRTQIICLPMHVLSTWYQTLALQTDKRLLMAGCHDSSKYWRQVGLIGFLETINDRKINEEIGRRQIHVNNMRFDAALFNIPHRYPGNYETIIVNPTHHHRFPGRAICEPTIHASPGPFILTPARKRC